MQLQPSQTFDPEQVLQHVWQNDYPAAWHVFFGPVRSPLLFLLVTLQVLIGMAGLLLCVGLIATVISPAGKSMPDALGIIFFVAVILLVPIGLIALLQLGVRRVRKRTSLKPRSLMVVMPEGVVAYRRKQTRAIFFAHIAQMQLRVKANRKTVSTYTTTTGADGTIAMIPSTTTAPAAPSIWLDLVFQGGQRGVWSIEIAPQDAIAQCIIEMYAQYRLQAGF